MDVMYKILLVINENPKSNCELIGKKLAPYYISQEIKDQKKITRTIRGHLLGLLNSGTIEAQYIPVNHINPNVQDVGIPPFSEIKITEKGEEALKKLTDRYRLS